MSVARRLRGVVTRWRPGPQPHPDLVRLTPEDRAAATVLHRALIAGAARGGTAEAVAQAVREAVAAEPRAALRGLDVVDASTFEPAAGRLPARAGVMVAAEFGGVLLIDQMEIP